MIPGLLTSLVIVGLVVFGRVREVEVPRRGRWTTTPVLCARDLEPATVRRAVDWWAVQGQPITLSCDGWNVSLDADPTIDLRDSIDDQRIVSGQTRVRTEDGAIVAAEILVLPDAGALTIAHEIGHALGWQHPVAAPSGHLLHPTRYGWDGRGLGP